PSPAPALPPTPASGGGTFPQLRRGTNPEKTNSERGFGSLHPLQLYPLPPPPAAVPSPSSAGGLIPKRRARNEGSIPFTRSLRRQDFSPVERQPNGGVARRAEGARTAGAQDTRPQPPSGRPQDFSLCVIVREWVAGPLGDSTSPCPLPCGCVTFAGLVVLGSGSL